VLVTPERATAIVRNALRRVRGLKFEPTAFAVPPYTITATMDCSHLEMADAGDAQLWLERVEDGGATVIIEDGSVKAVPA
jgi:hypothetical protein